MNSAWGRITRPSPVASRRLWMPADTTVEFASPRKPPSTHATRPRPRARSSLRFGVAAVDDAVEFLLSHWVTRRPIGPCHWGIGGLFRQVEYPFLRYNLFYYVHVLSFFRLAQQDERFPSAVAALEAKLDLDGQLVVERPHRGLKRLTFCETGEPSSLATERYREIGHNLSG